MASADQQAARNREVIIAKASGAETAAIAAKHGISTARVRQILAAGTVELIEAKGPDPVHAALERALNTRRSTRSPTRSSTRSPTQTPRRKSAPCDWACWPSIDCPPGIRASASSLQPRPESLRRRTSASIIAGLVDTLEELGFPLEKRDEVLKTMEAFDSEWHKTPEIEPPS